MKKNIIISRSKTVVEFINLIFSRLTIYINFSTQKLTSIKTLTIVCLALTIILMLTQRNTVHGYAYYEPEEFGEAVNDVMTNRTLTNAFASGTLFSNITISNFLCLMSSHVDPKTNKNGSVYCPRDLVSPTQTGVIPALARTTQSFYHAPPANLAYWIKDTGTTLGFFPKTTYAQGIYGRGVGFSGMAPFLDIWKAFRNIAYALVSFAIIIVGFMIMLRKKIDPQTVVTIQESLPRIIIVLVLITFSYPIAGFLIDLMYVALFVVYGVFEASGLIGETLQSGRAVGVLDIPIPPGREFREILLSGTILEAFYLVFPKGIGDLATISSWFFTGGSSDNWLVSAVGGLLGAFLLSILMLLLFIRLFFLFLGAYLQIVFYIIFSPLYILPDVLPGNNSVSKWIKNIIANLSVFVVSGVVFMTAAIFHSKLDGDGVEVWVPPYAGFGSTLQSITALLTIGIFVVLPSIARSFKEKIQASELNIGGGVGGGLARAANFAYGMAVLGSNYIRRGKGNSESGGAGSSGSH